MVMEVLPAQVSAQVFPVHPGSDASAHARHTRPQHGARARQVATPDPALHGQETLRHGELVLLRNIQFVSL